MRVATWRCLVFDDMKVSDGGDVRKFYEEGVVRHGLHARGVDAGPPFGEMWWRDMKRAMVDLSGSYARHRIYGVG